ncbi:MAG TPA: hypothetical protein VNV42_11200 [Solirubrobacteraceae bacterium]|jgi:hypothetical protein|nr:hypothetical protein [Solirubrobacteraceae bacterium]
MLRPIFTISPTRRSPTPSRSSRRSPTAALVALALALAGAALAPASQAAVKTKPPGPPRASTEGALHTGESTVALNATVNPEGQETTCYFQYGTTTAYGSQTPAAAAGTGTVAVKVSQPIAGLAAGTTYHYRIVAANAGGTIAGQDHTFTTKRIPLRWAITGATKTSTFGSPVSLTGTLTGTGAGGRQVMLQESAFPYVNGFADVGAPQTTNAEGGFTFALAKLAQTSELRVRTVEPTPFYSPPVTVHVAVAVKLRARIAKRLVHFSGTVTPAAAGAPIVFQWLGPGGRYVRVGGAVVRTAAAGFSRFRATLAIRRSGYYRALVRVSNGRQVSGASNRVRLRATVVRKTRRRRR